MTAKTFPLWLSGVVSLAALLLAFLTGPDAGTQAQLAARWTARVGFPLFILTYSASALVRLWPEAGWKGVLRHRRQWGLAFALAHTVHLAALVTFFVVSGQQPVMATVVGGGFAYVLLYLMVLTSNDRARRSLGSRWTLLHSTGIHVIWFVYTFSYFGRLFDPGRFAQGAALLPVCLAALALRLAAWAKTRRKRASA